MISFIRYGGDAESFSGKGSSNKVEIFQLCDDESEWLNCKIQVFTRHFSFPVLLCGEFYFHVDLLPRTLKSSMAFFCSNVDLFVNET